MGAWGEEALDNDSALDFMGDDITDELNDIVSKYLEQDLDVYSFRALAKFAEVNINSCGFWIKEKSARKLLEGLKEILNDEDWIRDWKEPEEIKKEVQKQINYFETVIRDQMYRKEK